MTLLSFLSWRPIVKRAHICQTQNLNRCVCKNRTDTIWIMQRTCYYPALTCNICCWIIICLTSFNKTKGIIKKNENKMKIIHNKKKTVLQMKVIDCLWIIWFSEIFRGIFLISNSLNGCFTYQNNTPDSIVQQEPNRRWGNRYNFSLLSDENKHSNFHCSLLYML